MYVHNVRDKIFEEKKKIQLHALMYANNHNMGLEVHHLSMFNDLVVWQFELKGEEIRRVKT